MVQNELTFRQIVDSVPGMIAVANAKGESEYLNKRALDYLDTTAEEFGKHPMETVHPEDQELLRNEWLRCNALGQPMDRISFQMNAASLPHAKLMKAIETIGTRVAPPVRDA
jgi:PAS domain S-box-containing protein